VRYVTAVNGYHYPARHYFDNGTLLPSDFSFFQQKSGGILSIIPFKQALASFAGPVAS